MQLFESHQTMQRYMSLGPKQQTLLLLDFSGVVCWSDHVLIRFGSWAQQAELSAVKLIGGLSEPYAVDNLLQLFVTIS